ncbi:MAG: hypothetical protein N2109_05155 [Fimbriimonadales bacterium]|nr:hypothetical protein [Fimbriimonadales bacterium]
MVAPARALLAAAMASSVALCWPAVWLPDVERQLERARDMASAGRPDRARAYLLTVAPPRISLAWAVRPEDACEGARALRTASEAWNRALGGVGAFVWLEQAGAADVVVSVRETLGDGTRSFAGFTRWTRSVRGGSGRLTGELALATRSRDGRRLTPAELLHAALHELGHLLGLADAAEASSVMSPLGLGSPLREPSAEDARAVLRLRSEALGLLSR